MKDKTPNPGSDEALALGCLCPVMDNCHGQGAYGPGSDVFWVDDSCKLHGPKIGLDKT